MLKAIGFILLIHAAISLIRYRKHLIYNEGTNYSIPIDILVEIIVGFSLNMFFGIMLDKQFLNIHQYPPGKTYDSAFAKPNFKSPAGRGAVLVQALKKRLGNFDFIR